MATATHCSRIPDVALPRIGGGELNPSALIGQKLVVIFCPTDPARGAAFLFEQWGCFGHAWTGAGHANEVLAEARRRN